MKNIHLFLFVFLCIIEYAWADKSQYINDINVLNTNTLKNSYNNKDGIVNGLVAFVPLTNEISKSPTISMSNHASVYNRFTTPKINDPFVIIVGLLCLVILLFITLIFIILKNKAKKQSKQLDQKFLPNQQFIYSEYELKTKLRNKMNENIRQELSDSLKSSDTKNFDQKNTDIYLVDNAEIHVIGQEYQKTEVLLDSNISKVTNNKQTPDILSLNTSEATNAYSEINKGGWRVFGCSMQGKDHLKANPAIPCQDNHCILPIDDGWGVVVVCDGAGSHKYSHIGSKFVSKYVAQQAYKGIKETNFYQSHTLPSEEGWRNWCKALVWQTRQALGDFVKIQKQNVDDIDVSNVGCTLIFSVYSPYGILSAHIGDGRAGYRNVKNWQSMIMPFNGEYANQTVFLNSDYIYQHRLENPQEPNKPYLETRVIAGKITGFVLMSDGCENGLYYVDEYDPIEKTVKTINRPIDGFDGIIQMLKDAEQHGEKAEDLFLKIIRQGNQPLVEEGDDKTLVLGYLID